MLAPSQANLLHDQELIKTHASSWDGSPHLDMEIRLLATRPMPRSFKLLDSFCTMNMSSKDLVRLTTLCSDMFLLQTQTHDYSCTLSLQGICLFFNSSSQGEHIIALPAKSNCAMTEEKNTCCRARSAMTFLTSPDRRSVAPRYLRPIAAVKGWAWARSGCQVNIFALASPSSGGPV